MKKRIILPLLFIASNAILVSCNLDVVPEGALTVAINYDGNDNRITYQKDIDYSTPNGTKVAKGDFKPVWRELQKRLGISLTEYEDAVSSGKATNYFNLNWQTKQYADIASANVVDVNNFSVAGSNETILDLKPYVDKTTFDSSGNIVEHGPMDNFATFLNKNPTVKMSIISAKHSHAEKGAIYYLPYFDGFDDIERMPLVRADYIRTLLDKDSKDFDTTYKLEKASYQPFVVNEDKTTAPDYSVDIMKLKAGSTTEYEASNFTKKSTENIISRQNTLIASGEASSKALVDQFKSYCDDRYGTPGTADALFSTYSDLFLNYSSCYDADEMIALMRIIKASPKTLLGSDTTKEMVPFTSRQCDNHRSADLYRWAGQLWGIRGVESRTGYLYLNGIDKNGHCIVHDCRGDEAILTMLKNLNCLYEEKLILQDFDTKTADGSTEGKFAQDIIVGNGNDHFAGFMEHDYAQSQGAWNDKEASTKITGYDFRPILGAVAKWDTDNDNTPDKYMRFTESWRSVKTQGLVLRAGLADETSKLYKALKFVDYFYSEEGQMLNSFGPEGDGYTSGTIEYQGRNIPEFTQAALDQLNDKNIGGGSYTNYLRNFVGATLPVGYVKEQGMEYQCTTKNAKAGLDIINKAIQLKTFKHVRVDDPTDITVSSQKPFYKIVPSSFFLTKGQASAISDLSDKTKLGSIFFDSSTSSFNIWDSYVMGKVASGAPTLDDYIDTVTNTWQLKKYVAFYQDAYEAMES